MGIEHLDLEITTSVAACTRSQHTFRLARSWISNCLTGHFLCGASSRRSTEPSLPTRLLTVSAHHDGTGFEARLSHSCELPPQTQYTSLSHSWGTEKFLTLRKANYAQFRESVSVPSLSQTFQDAISATIQLGYQHVWIDSLCIIQDDAQDWEYESKRMADVYRNAICNLSASGFSSGVNGFLMDKRLNNPVPPRVTLKTAQGKRYWLTVRRPKDALVGGTLFNRAWVMQEQVLVCLILLHELHLAD